MKEYFAEFETVSGQNHYRHFDCANEDQANIEAQEYAELWGWKVITVIQV